jgi:predicted phosphodiesterase
MISKALLLSIALVIICFNQVASQNNNQFLIKPYIQLGNEANLNNQESLFVLWAKRSDVSDYVIEFKQSNEKIWRKCNKIETTDIVCDSDVSFKLYKALLNNLQAGENVDYRFIENNKIVFSSQAHVRKNKTQSYKAAIFGDLAYGGPGQIKIANQVYKENPDLIVLPGDIVYHSGRISEYLQKYFPVYNADFASVFQGAPIIRSIPTIAAPGNHDVAIGSGDLSGNLAKFPDGLAYFLLWLQPLNGPIDAITNSNVAPIIGNTKQKNNFLKTAGTNYPRMANFSFDYGNSHWLILDANTYMNWSDPLLRSWVNKDLKSTTSKWKFVVFHQPSFNSDKKHQKEQQMRLLCDIFENSNVDIVFSGHAHNYQRSYPLTFKVIPPTLSINSDGTVDGTLKIDKKFDGIKHTNSEGVIYIVTGAGGAKLSGVNLQSKPSMWQPFTCKFIASSHSYTLLSVNDRNLELQQISETGNILDRFCLSK